MTIVQDENSSTDGLAIVDKFEALVNYLYPILQTCPRKHGVLRDAVLSVLFATIGDLHHASKSRQVSRLYTVDAQFATLRSHLRFLEKIHAVSPKQRMAALALLSQPGGMLNSWIGKLRGQAGK